MLRVGIGIWMSLIGIGFYLVELHAARPGIAMTEERPWSAQAELALSFDQPNLLVFVHPHCNCTLATLTELNRLMTTLHAKTHLYIIFYKAAGKADDWLKGDNWQLAEQIPDAHLLGDANGKLAEKLNVKTSGQVLLYGKNQALIYAGGIVPRRGHTGDSVGQQMILNYFRDGKNKFTSGLVYGCSLVSAKLKLADVF